MHPFCTPLCRRLGIELPIVQAPMGTSVSPALVAAVCNAGGLGMIPGTWVSAKELSQQMTEVAFATEKPFGVNLILVEKIEANLELALEAGIGIISFFWGDPTPFVERVHAAGALVMHTVASAAEARKVVNAGVDIVVAQGVEAGGHVWSEVGTMVLVPAVVDAIPGTPVIAAGGIGDGRGAVAALALGAEAAWIGTRFLLAEESFTHPEYRQRLIDARETDTILSKAFDDGWPNAPHRCLINETVTRWIAAGRPAPGLRPLEGQIFATDAFDMPIPIYSAIEPSASMIGEIRSMALYAGQSVALAKRIQPAAQIVGEIVAEMEAVVGRMREV